MSQVLDSVLDDQRRADCARNAKIMQDDMRDLIKIVKARAAANERPVRRAAALVPATPHTGRRDGGYGNYGMSCVLCGGTPSGDSTRGYVGRCNCGSVA